jgi:hypothetical protein
MLLFDEGLEKTDVLRIGQDTVSIEYHGDGPQWRILEDGKVDPIYPWFAVRPIMELTDQDIERIGEEIKVHLKKRKVEVMKDGNTSIGV